MPIVFGVLGILLIVSGVRGTVTGTNPSLVSLIKDDFTGQPNYIEWVIAIIIIGSIGYIPKMEPISRAFMVLVIVGLFLSNKGFFAQLQNATKSTSPIGVQQGTPVPSTGLPQLPQLPSLGGNT